MGDLDISYLRVSTAQQRTDQTIESQRFTLGRYFEQNGIQVDPSLQFEDDGVSGGVEIQRRLGGGQVYELIRKGLVRRLFLFHSDRIGRDTIDTLLFHRLAASNGTQIIGIADGADSFAEGGALSTEIKAVIAAEYRRDVTRRTKSGLRRRAAAGKISTRPPFGYLLGPDGRLVLEEVRADVVARNFAAVARGERTRDIVLRLNESSAPSPRGMGWRHDTFIYMLKNTAYMGEFHSFRTPRRRLGGGARIPRDPSETVVIPCPPIVSRELFEAVQDRLKFNRRWYATPGRRVYMLKSLIVCGLCGHSYVGHAITGRRHNETCYPDFRYYECGTLSNRDYTFCKNVRLNADRIEGAIWDEIERFMESPTKVIERLTARYGRQVSTDLKRTSRRSKKLEELKGKNLEDRKRLALAVARGILADEDARLASESLVKEAAALLSEEAQIARLRTGATAEKNQLFGAEALLQALRAQLEQGLPAEKKSEIARRLVRRAIVNKGDDGRARVTVQYVFPSPVSFSPDGLGFPDPTAQQLTEPVITKTFIM